MSIGGCRSISVSGALRGLTSWLRLYYMTPVTVYYKLTANFPASGSFRQISQGVVGPNG